jgi:hypothetical protein
MKSHFPWADVQSFDAWCREYAEAPSIANLNHLHLCASMLYAKLSTFCMDTNAQRVDVE